MVMTWIWLPGLPGFMYKRMILEEIGGIVRKVAKLDFKMNSKTRGRFSRMAVFINLDKPLVSQEYREDNLGFKIFDINEVGEMEGDEGVTCEHSSDKTKKEKESIPIVAKGSRVKENFKKNLSNGFGTSRGLDEGFETLVRLAKSVEVCVGGEANLGRVYVGLATKKIKKRLV
ncbi:hypothetical protein GOBAR_AA22363 [Gossypium barbadense]|uniref:DUF4283 domain-containing protein n=1 Tax=Gossypium barbadense TaxID=3634 RepID=A0A2P5X4Q1_GOSBA|nr:hypothetical protein GOBAR_AA22363 [Gossypium barbadense]